MCSKSYMYYLIQDIEPGLEQSETFYSLTFSVLFLGYSIGSLVVGFVYNFIPAWYLFLFSTLSYTLGYLLYALATSGWMMILARGLAGIHIGAITTLMFTYFGASFEKYSENQWALGNYDEKNMKRLKGYLFSTFGIGTTLGYAVGLGRNKRTQIECRSYVLQNVIMKQLRFVVELR